MLGSGMSSTLPAKGSTICHKGGFLTHLSMTLHLIIPFFKGLVHLITKSWRLKRSKKGGKKMINKQWDAYMFQSLEEESILKGRFEVIITGNEPNFLPPGLVKPAPELLEILQSDLEALTDILDQAGLPKMSVRISKLRAIYYGFFAVHLALGLVTPS